MLTIQELRSSTDKELLQELEAARKNYLKVRISTKTKHEKNTAKVQKAKYYVAQILTVLKELKAAPKPSKAEQPKTEKAAAPEKEIKEKK